MTGTPVSVAISCIPMIMNTTERSMTRSKSETIRGLLLQSSSFFLEVVLCACYVFLSRLDFVSRRSATLFIFCSFPLLTYSSFGIVFVSSCGHAIRPGSNPLNFLAENLNFLAPTARYTRNEYVFAVFLQLQILNRRISIL